jgi:hypothetical protein
MLRAHHLQMDDWVLRKVGHIVKQQGSAVRKTIIDLDKAFHGDLWANWTQIPTLTVRGHEYSKYFPMFNNPATTDPQGPARNSSRATTARRLHPPGVCNVGGEHLCSIPLLHIGLGETRHSDWKSSAKTAPQHFLLRTSLNI